MDAAEAIGISSTSRLQDLFVRILGITPEEFNNGDKTLTIFYGFSETLFGNVLFASKTKRILLWFFMIRIHQKKEIILLDLKSYIPNVEFIDYCDMCQLKALKIFDGNEKDLNQIKLHLKGIDF